MATTRCIDASLVVRRVLFPDDASLQNAWDEWEAQGDMLAAPALIFYEVTNVLHRYRRESWLSAAACQSALEAALALPIELYNDASLHRRAFELAGQYHLPAAYDAHYLALAERLAVTLYTANKRLLNSLRTEEAVRVCGVPGSP
jgi:predicted nucleic acid-binding protein